MLLQTELARKLEKFSIPEPTSGCHLWVGGLSVRGYGVMILSNKSKQAHRVSYEVAKGQIPEGLVIDHLCSMPSCINPDHLEAVTQRENVIRDLRRKGRYQKHLEAKRLLLQTLKTVYEYLTARASDVDATILQTIKASILKAEAA